MARVRVAGYQLDFPAGEPEAERRQRVAEILAGAPASDLLALPELWDVGYFAFDRYQLAAMPLDEGPVTALSALSSPAVVVAGSVLERSPTGVHNTIAVLGSGGQLVGAYRKMHLFRYGSREGELLTPGAGATVVDVGGLNVGLATCFDLRFPEQFAAMRDAGADVFVVPAAWPAARASHWEVLVRARAIETQTPVAAVNGVGPCHGVELAGRSMVVDARGEVVATAGSGRPGWLEATIDTDDTCAWRQEFPLRAAAGVS
ncbi:MAG TPA: nitrilase-related carbon-nitrogen hydrolase [Acidimicrobiales bacterium]|nr:nitrilase-related carbon-nitrogen hydrolase [Acidimicrobiales bacterium]